MPSTRASATKAAAATPARCRWTKSRVLYMALGGIATTGTERR